jgi:carotenoid cleavage dioxygenase-like enzyme
LDADDSTIIIDAFVSQLNSARESSQFELSGDREVFDNNGDPYRFIVKIPGDDTSLDLCKSKLIASVVDSTIDFHCINSNYNGVNYRFTWIVGHERNRDVHGEVSKVVSSLYKIHLPDCCSNSSELFNCSFDSKTTVTHCIKSDQWTENSCYLRTPMFVPRKGATEEDDGYLFMWSYEFGESKISKLIILSAKDLSILIEIPIPNESHIPYSVHSWIYPFLAE